MRRSFSLATLALCLGLAATPVLAALPQVGQPAPDFRLQDQNGHWQALGDHHGRYLVVYFYPKDFTGGCTKEVCAFRDDLAKLRQAGADVVGVSLDDVKSHGKFAQKYHVPFPLLADSDRKVTEAYGVLNEHLGIHYAKRTTFLIDPQGKVAEVYEDVDPEKNSGQVLADLTRIKALQ